MSDNLPDPLEVLGNCGNSTASAPMTPDLATGAPQRGTLSDVGLKARASSGSGKTPKGNTQIWFNARFTSEEPGDDQGRSVGIRNFVVDGTTLQELEAKIANAGGGPVQKTELEQKAHDAIGRFKAEVRDKIGVHHPALEEGSTPTMAEWADIINSLNGASVYLNPVRDGRFMNYNFISEEQYQNLNGGGMETPQPLGT